MTDIKTIMASEIIFAGMVLCHLKQENGLQLLKHLQEKGSQPAIAEVQSLPPDLFQHHEEILQDRVRRLERCPH